MIRMMKNTGRWAKQWSTLLFALLLAGCASTDGPSVEDLRAVRSIKIAPSLNPMRFIFDFGDFGANTQSQDLTHALVAQDMRLGDELTQMAAQQLRSEGFEVTNSLSSAVSSDATLRLSITASGYARRGFIWDKIGPHLVVVATLTDRVGKKLFYRIYRYDMHTISMGSTLGLTPSDRFGFDSAEAVTSHPELAAAGLQAAIPMITADIGRALRKRRR